MNTKKFFCLGARTSLPDGRFHLILCRNLVFTYFDEVQQEEILAEPQAKLPLGGWWSVCG